MLGLLHYMWSILQSCVVHITTKGSNMDRFADISFSLYFHFQAFSYHVVQVWCKEWCALYIQRNLSLWDQKLYFHQYLIKSGPYWKPLPYYYYNNNNSNNNDNDSNNINIIFIILIIIVIITTTIK